MASLGSALAKRSRVVFSGIQPTGVPHIGNHLGALSKWQSLVQEQLNKPHDEPRDRLFFSVVGLHALTVPQDPKKLLQERTDMFAVLLALGLGEQPGVDVTLFHQDMVPQHSELSWYLNCITPVGRLLRMTSWKSKLATLRNANSEDEVDDSLLQLGLLAYPVLQTADILLYKTTHVPVGNDQTQHLELCRDLAESFNRLYPDTSVQTDVHRKKKQRKKNQKGVFELPQVMLTDYPRIQSLRNPLSKMSKSSPHPNSVMFLTDSPSTIRSKLKSAVTDSIEGVSWDPVERPGISNLLQIHSGYSHEPIDEIVKRFPGGTAGKGIREFKEELTEVVSEGLSGFRSEYERIRLEHGWVHEMERRGAERARIVAEETMQQRHAVRIDFPRLSGRPPARMSASEWTPSSWRQKPIGQAVEYPTPTRRHDAESDPDPVVYRKKLELNQVVDKLERLPPIVSAVEIEKLKQELAKVAKGEAFLLQGGDCAELFDYATSEKIEHRLSLLLSMSLILIWGLKVPVVRLARMGGQYAKPRSKQTEIVEGKEINSFRGDNVNGISPDDRLPDPERLLQSYFHSASTVNHVRSLLASGFASLPHNSGENVPWSLPLEHVRDPELLKSYEAIVGQLSQALEFMSVVGGRSNNKAMGALESAEIFMSHEGLMLEYESALTRKCVVPAFARTSPDSPQTGYYCTSAHFLWIGDRTRALTGAHVEFFRGLRNPIGIKVGPSMKAEELIELLEIVNPTREEGRITLIARYGASLVEDLLPGHIQAVQQSGHPVVWISDPMHGNTQTSSLPPFHKTRHMSSLVSELLSSLKIHQQLGSRLGGVHLELTGDITEDGLSVTECLGGSMRLEEESLGLRFESHCDPRLNFEQSLDIAFMLSQAGGKSRGRSNQEDNKILEELASRSNSVQR
ncbi:tryptophan--tRNA ligase MSW1 [Sporobolomyces koalae]|uniref:tryptophan--tRNA ligase MSW1 n=1 Tax=Sporobolomyces koalae TaxID=500713 RepID=UPI00316D298C